MFAELLRRGSMRRPEETERALTVIEKESSRLSILVDNVLNYARLRRESGTASSDETHSTDVNRDIEYVMDAFAPLAREKDVKLTSTSEVRSLASVDSQALRQLLLNLLENAVKYGPRGQTVTIGASESADNVRVWIDDEGPGVPDEERDAIWIPFQRGKVGIQSRAGGSGIGLSVVRDLAAEHGGKVWVDPSNTGGARFIAEFGVAKPDSIEDKRRDVGLRAASGE
jgi:signal transduction histidine kinase